MELISRDKLLKMLICDEANYENIVEQNGATDHFTSGMLVGTKLAIASVLQATTEDAASVVIDYVDNALKSRPHRTCFWINEYGQDYCVDVGYAEDWWDNCMSPELRRVFGVQEEK